MQKILALSIRAWTPVFEKMQPAVPDYVYNAFYPAGWQTRQLADIEQLLATESQNIFVADASGEVAGFVGVRIHPEDQMGEIYILAVDPDHQRGGVATSLMEFAFDHMRKLGLAMVMVETGGDPGHATSRACYESVGFERWPVARYFKKL